MTLWELAQSWPHEPGRMFMAKGIPTRPSCGNGCRRCQLERWAREKAKESEAIDPYPFKNQTAREISKDFSIAIKEMLGVPEGQ